MKRFADLDGPDFFPTPRWATFALTENEKFNGEIWECACGDGTMSRVLEETGQPVRSTDLYDRGFGEAGVDFSMSQSEADNTLPIRHTIALKGSSLVASNSPNENLLFCSGWHFWKE